MVETHRPIKAVISKVCGQGQERYVVTYLKDYSQAPEVPVNDTVTFSIDAWEGQVEPEVNQVVVFPDGLQEYSRGWRALKAKPSQSGVKQKATRKQKRRKDYGTGKNS
jgi:hypothetical protein